MPRKEQKPEIRKLDPVMVEHRKAPYPTSIESQGLFREQIDLWQRYNSKRSRIIRMELSALEIRFLMHRLASALGAVEGRMIRSANSTTGVDQARSISKERAIEGK